MIIYGFQALLWGFYFIFFVVRARQSLKGLNQEMETDKREVIVK